MPSEKKKPAAIAIATGFVPAGPKSPGRQSSEPYGLVVGWVVPVPVVPVPIEPAPG